MRAVLSGGQGFARAQLTNEVRKVLGFDRTGSLLEQRSEPLSTAFWPAAWWGKEPRGSGCEGNPVPQGNKSAYARGLLGRERGCIDR